MLTFRDLVTGDISDSPSDRLAAPLVFFIGFPIFGPCTLVYYTAKGVKYVGEKAVEKISDKIAEKKARKVVEAVGSNGSEVPLKTITRTDETAMPIIETKQNKKPKKLILKRDNKKM